MDTRAVDMDRWALMMCLSDDSQHCDFFLYIAYLFSIVEVEYKVSLCCEEAPLSFVAHINCMHDYQRNTV